MGPDSRIHSIAPRRLLVTARGGARVRVQGRAHGRLRVGCERRWVWGHFDEELELRPRHGQRSIDVVLTTLGGRSVESVELALCRDICPPDPPEAPQLRRRGLAVPSPVRVGATLPGGPRVVRLARMRRDHTKRDDS